MEQTLNKEEPLEEPKWLVGVWWLAPSQGKLFATYSVCAVWGMAGCRESKGCSESKPGTHRDERKTAARVDRDATREVELGAGAGAVAECKGM